MLSALREASKFASAVSMTTSVEPTAPRCSISYILILTRFGSFCLLDFSKGASCLYDARNL